MACWKGEEDPEKVQMICEARGHGDETTVKFLGNPGAFIERTVFRIREDRGWEESISELG